MAHNLYYGSRDGKPPPLDRWMKRSSGVGPVIYFFAALLIATLAFAWMSASDRSLPLIGGWTGNQPQASDIDAAPRT
jgi:hypothetical protein